MCECVTRTDSYIQHACLMSMEVRIGHWIPRDWSYRWLPTTLWVLGTELGFSPGTTSALNY